MTATEFIRVSLENRKHLAIRLFRDGRDAPQKQPTRTAGPLANSRPSEETA